MAGARLSLPVYAGGSLVAGAAAAGQASRRRAGRARQAAADLRLDVATHYVGVLRARRALGGADAAVESLAAHVADVEVMVERESVATNDLLAARVALANARQQRLRAANAVEMAQAGYNRRLGQPLDRVPDLEERLGRRRPSSPGIAGSSSWSRRAGHARGTRHARRRAAAARRRRHAPSGAGCCRRSR